MAKGGRVETIMGHMDTGFKGWWVLVWFLIIALGRADSTSPSSRHIVFSIAQEVTLSDSDRPLKNFYVNIGRNQGIREGVVLDVFRVLSRLDPHKAERHYNFRAKVGELKIIHAESDSAIASLHPHQRQREELYFEVDGIMIGDYVAVQVTP